MYIKVERIDKPLFNWLIAGCTRSLKKSKSLDLIFFVNASYGGEANMRLRTTSSSKTKSVEFYPIFLALSFCLFQNIFGRSTLDKWWFLRIASNVTRNISRWTQCFSVILLVCLVVYVLPVTMNISQSFQNGVKKKERLRLSEMS